MLSVLCRMLSRINIVNNLTNSVNSTLQLAEGSNAAAYRPSLLPTIKHSYKKPNFSHSLDRNQEPFIT